MGTGSGLPVADVRADSLAAEVEIEAGDRITRINGQDVEDLVDFHFLACDDVLEMEVLKGNGELWVIDLEKGPEEDFGILFGAVSAEGTKRCCNKCLFCFVDQMPIGMRSSLYEKDDDYRLSLTQGSFITLTNLKEQDFERIVKLHLSPLYISVHATDAAIRKYLLGNPQAGKILQQIKLLSDAGITMHTQVVLVPGINDGEVLARTIEDLYRLYPSVQSLAVVPVGITTFRDNLAPLTLFDAMQARQILEDGAVLQEKFRLENGNSFVYFSDEFYVKAGMDFPPAVVYDDFAQLENGVGLSRLFIDEVIEAIEEYSEFIATAQLVVQAVPGVRVEHMARVGQVHSSKSKIHLVTGISACKVMEQLVTQVKEKLPELEVCVHALENRFFGTNVTVAGLLTGTDLINGLAGKLTCADLPEVRDNKKTAEFRQNSKFNEYKLKLEHETNDEQEKQPELTRELVLIPRVMLNADGIFLDGLTPGQVADKLGVKIEIVELDGRDFVNSITGQLITKDEV